MNTRKCKETAESMEFRYQISKNLFYMIGLREIAGQLLVMHALIDFDEYIYDLEDIIKVFYPSVEHFEAVYQHNETQKREALCDCIYYYYNDWHASNFDNTRQANKYIRQRIAEIDEFGDVMFANIKPLV